MTLHPLPTAKTPSGYRVLNRGVDRGEIYLYGPIGDYFGGVSADQFRQDLQSLGKVKVIDLFIYSGGGDVFAAKAMYSLLINHPATVNARIDGLAASAATFVALAAKTIAIPADSFFMIHEPAALTQGTIADHEKNIGLLKAVRDTMVDLYAGRSKIAPDEIRQMMAVETYMNGKEAVDRGFADTVLENLKVAAASFENVESLKHLPAALQPNRVKAAALIERMKASRA
jgi:ATP-dependent Clp protease protease subunit